MNRTLLLLGLTLFALMPFQAVAADCPSNAAALMYDTLDIVRMCAEKSGLSGKPDDLDKDRERMRDCLARVKDYKAPVTGSTTFNGDGDALRQPVVLVVRKGKFESVR